MDENYEWGSGKIDSLFGDDVDWGDWGQDIPQRNVEDLVTQVQELKNIALIMRVESIMLHNIYFKLLQYFKFWHSTSNNIFYMDEMTKQRAEQTQLQTMLANERVKIAQVNYELMKKKRCISRQT